MPTDDPDPRLDEVFGPDAVRWRTLDELMTGHHLASPHHYLFAIGVLPDYQGNGLGGALLAHGHRRFGGMTSYLEASSPDSRRLSHRHGYTDLGRIGLPDGPSPWRMQHNPVPVEDRWLRTPGRWRSRRCQQTPPGSPPPGGVMSLPIQGSARCGPVTGGAYVRRDASACLEVGPDGGGSGGRAWWSPTSRCGSRSARASRCRH